MDKFQVLPAKFIRCLLLVVRTIFDAAACSDMMFWNVASFLKLFQDVISNPAVDGPEPAFIEQQTLGEVFCETDSLVVDETKCPVVEYEHDCKYKKEEFDALLQKYSCCCVTPLLVSSDIAKDFIRSCDVFQQLLCLCSLMIAFKKSKATAGVWSQMQQRKIWLHNYEV